MPFYEKTNRFIVLGIILTVGFGCKFLRPKENVETVEEPKKTAITKELLVERLTARSIKIAAERPGYKPNPLTLQLKFSTGNNNFLLNNELVSAASFCDQKKTSKRSKSRKRRRLQKNF